jgi:hypothetical protein
MPARAGRGGLRKRRPGSVINGKLEPPHKGIHPMKYFLFFVYMSLGFVIWLFVGAQMLLPILYGLPRSIYHFFKHEVTIMAIISNLATPIFWFIAIAVLGFIVEATIPALNDFLMRNPAFGLGQALATLMLLSGFLTRKGRADMSADYEHSTLRRFQKVQNQNH